MRCINEVKSKKLHGKLGQLIWRAMIGFGIGPISKIQMKKLLEKITVS